MLVDYGKQSMSTVKQKICLVVDGRYAQSQPRALEHAEWIEDDDDYVIVSEIVEVEFPELSVETVVSGKLEVLKRQEEKETERHAEALHMIEEARSKLLALTHDS